MHLSMKIPTPPPPPSRAMVGHAWGFVKKICPTDGAFAFLFTNRILLVAEVIHKDRYGYKASASHFREKKAGCFFH